jgi:hypothetical protein
VQVCTLTESGATGAVKNIFPCLVDAFLKFNPEFKRCFSGNMSDAQSRFFPNEFLTFAPIFGFFYPSQQWEPNCRPFRQ